MGGGRQTDDHGEVDALFVVASAAFLGLSGALVARNFTLLQAMGSLVVLAPAATVLLFLSFTGAWRGVVLSSAQGSLVGAGWASTRRLLGVARRESCAIADMGGGSTYALVNVNRSLLVRFGVFRGDEGEYEAIRIGVLPTSFTGPGWTSRERAAWADRSSLPGEIECRLENLRADEAADCLRRVIAFARDFRSSTADQDLDAVAVRLRWTDAARRLALRRLALRDLADARVVAAEVSEGAGYGLALVAHSLLGESAAVLELLQDPRRPKDVVGDHIAWATRSGIGDAQIPILALLADGTLEDRLLVLHTLRDHRVGVLAGLPVEPQIIALMEEGSHALRVAAAEALGAMGGTEARGALKYAELKGLTTTAEARAVRAALAALERRLGTSSPEDRGALTLVRVEESSGALAEVKRTSGALSKAKEASTRREG